MRRFTSEEKGKGKISDQPTRPRVGIRASDLDTSRLISENALTLIGRITNRKEQSMAAVLPYLTRKWNLVGRTHGSDLGNDCFQFWFLDENDMRTVLANRPYQYGQWMIILQQWEPIISPTFPSQIPFWINLRGIPLHFWDDRTIRDIGQELGELEDYNLTKTTTKVRVMMDGLKPLPQDTILEFSAGEECIIALKYEKLENLCTYGLRLSHIDRDCPDKPPVARLDVQKPERSYHSREGPQRTQHSPRIHHSHRQHTERIPSPTRHTREQTAFQQRVDRHGNPFGERTASYYSRAPPLRNKIIPPTQRQEPRQQTHRSIPHRYSKATTSPQPSACGGEQPRRTLNQNVRNSPEQVWREKTQHVTHRRTEEPAEEQTRPPRERNLERVDFPPP